MNNAAATQSLSNLLRLDAVTCIAMGAALVLADGFIAGLTGLPALLLFYAGIALLPIGVFIAATAAWWSDAALPVWLIVLGNVGWVLASLAILAEVPSVTSLGFAFVLAQAAVVALFAYLEWRDLSRLTVLA